MARISATALRRALAESRRSATRYDIRLGLRYTAMRRGETPTTGVGESVNISRTGLLFRCEGRPQTRDNMIVVLDWPVSAPDGEPLKLIITGEVVRIRRPLVGLAIHTHRLLRQRELDKRFESFWGPLERQRAAAGPQRPTILIDETDNIALLVSMIVTPQNWAVERVDREAAEVIVARQPSGISLVVTRTPELVAELPPEIPAILIVDEEPPAEVGMRPGCVILRRPVTDTELRMAIQQLCHGAAGTIAMGGTTVQ